MWKTFSRGSASLSRLVWSRQSSSTLYRLWATPMGRTYGWFCSFQIQSCFTAESVLRAGTCRDSRVETLSSEVFNPQEITSNHQLSSESKSRNQQSQFVTQTQTSSQSYLQWNHQIQTCVPQAICLQLDTRDWRRLGQHRPRAYGRRK